ncbi:MAG: hypothetical protein RLZ10_2368 [Bacteroidota bacterium]|jgi:hypothetical protein
MKVTIIHKQSGISEKHYKFYDKFIKFLQEEIPLREDLTILFISERVGSMTTGSRDKNGVLRILTKNRINRDIFRTIAHEWIHEHQMKILKRKNGPDIGGKNEDEANAKAGSLIKKFEKKNPKLEKLMYA